MLAPGGSTFLILTMYLAGRIGAQRSMLPKAGEGGERSELPLTFKVKGTSLALSPLSPTLSHAWERGQN